ncbi:TPA: hypothetical protein DCX15_00140 [bacterium]|nr:hypothetical protein [bacterium]
MERLFRQQLVKRSILPFLLFALILILCGLYSLELKPILSEDIDRFLSKAAFMLLVLVVNYWFQKVFQLFILWYRENVASKRESSWGDEFLPLLRKAGSIVIWIIGILIILSNLGVNISALIATLGISSLAIALAAQDTISNIIAGFLIMIDRPFRIGDEIKLPSGEKVKVLDIGVRRSRFVDLNDGSIIITPNLELSRSKIVNFTYGRE